VTAQLPVVERLTDRWRRSADTRSGGALRALLRGAGGAAAAVTIALLHDAHDPGVLCPLRRFTGIPCPGCGSTSVFIEAGHGHLLAAVLANPVAVAVLCGLLIAPLGPGRWWWELSDRRRNVVICAALTVSWIWQLGRFGFL
jgi:hypothetical protein